ncbi:MAG: lysophospholipid acyltransferase family protein [Burkholderiaceae bacterium]|jgi:KDO2-lipid IV(A) lauroyltransferase|nr:lysophospholipid acyltransferase family protein [Burkholderiaceae bacterium]
MRFMVVVLWMLHWLPLPVLGRIGRVLGALAYHFLKERRGITLINLRLCFPDKTEAERVRLAKSHFQLYGRSVVERGILWWSSAARIKRLMHVVPAFPMEEVRAGPVIFLCPHFVCLEIPGVLLTFHATGCSIYTRQRNALADRMLKQGRTRFNTDSILVPRRAGIKPIIRALRKNMPFYMLPDMDFGLQDAEFVPFFGIPTATLVAPARIAHATHAKIVPVVPTFLPDYQGWLVTYYPPWENDPAVSVAEVAHRMNRFIEERVSEHPAEYWWTHRRFKSRPQGEPGFYETR